MVGWILYARQSNLQKDSWAKKEKRKRWHEVEVTEHTQRIERRKGRQSDKQTDLPLFQCQWQWATKDKHSGNLKPNLKCLLSFSFSLLHLSTFCPLLCSKLWAFSVCCFLLLFYYLNLCRLTHWGVCVCLQFFDVAVRKKAIVSNVKILQEFVLWMSAYVGKSPILYLSLTISCEVPFKLDQRRQKQKLGKKEKERTHLMICGGDNLTLVSFLFSCCWFSFPVLHCSSEH